MEVETGHDRGTQASAITGLPAVENSAGIVPSTANANPGFGNDRGAGDAPSPSAHDAAQVTEQRAKMDVETGHDRATQASADTAFPAEHNPAAFVPGTVNPNPTPPRDSGIGGASRDPISPLHRTVRTNAAEDLARANEPTYFQPIASGAFYGGFVAGPILPHVLSTIEPSALQRIQLEGFDTMPLSTSIHKIVDVF